MRPGSSNVWKRSFAIYEIADVDDWNSALMSLVEGLGGVDHLSAAILQIRPEFVEVDVSVPARESDEQEDRYLDADAVRLVARLGASFGILVS